MTEWGLGNTSWLRVRVWLDGMQRTVQKSSGKEAGTVHTFLATSLCACAETKLQR